MQEDPQVAEQRHRLGLPQGIDPRKALDSAAMERVLKAQALARAQAQAATTVVLGTVVTLVTSAFGFIAALAWNDAITALITKYLAPVFKSTGLGNTGVTLVKAIVLTILAVIVVVATQRVAGRYAQKSVINAAAENS
jgi:small-conductance mechanosensitive channel